MIELPSISDRNFQAIRQHTTRAALAIRAKYLDTPASYASLALLQVGTGELVRVYGAESVAALLAELAGELNSTGR